MSTAIRLALALLIPISASVAVAQPPTPAEIIASAVERGERTWRKAEKPGAGLSSRELFSYALALCEGNAHLERLDTLFEVAAQMQERDEEARGYGNFRWRWDDAEVLDYNAVEFCFQSGNLVWLRHRDKLSPKARALLEEMMGYAVEGCLRHRVPSSYTNISLMNAFNLIMLGELLGKPEVAEEGYRRLDLFCLYTYEFGIHEYCSPTYYGTDLDSLVLLNEFIERESGRKAAAALLELFWHDLALNWFEPAGKLAGARSRDYDYLRGLGYLGTAMRSFGWTDEGNGGPFYAITKAKPPARLRELNRTRYPRLIRQSWGEARTQSRTHYVLPDVTLSSSCANYGAMDLPLTVDFPGASTSVRGYFIPDGRHDPYGKVKIEAGGGHEKTLHLRPFFAAAQRTVDALGVVVYRERDVPEGTATLESHFVMPRDVDGCWVGDKQIDLQGEEPHAWLVESGQAVVFRKGTAAVGIRVPWSRSLAGEPAACALVYDGNDHGAVRLTVAHHDFWGLQTPQVRPGAALWVRIGSGLNTDADFDRWRKAFGAAQANVALDNERLQLKVSGVEGEVALGIEPPYAGCFLIEPSPTRAVLELDGKDIGRPLLADLEPIKSWVEKKDQLPALSLSVDRPLHWEAETGLIAAPMVEGEDPKALEGKFVWTPGAPGEKGGSPLASVTWRLNVAEKATYYLWARLQAATPDDDSFFLSLTSEEGAQLDNVDWHCGTHERWEWTALALDRPGEPTPLALPAGEVTLKFRCREDGAKVDALFLTADAEAQPD